MQFWLNFTIILFEKFVKLILMQNMLFLIGYTLVSYADLEYERWPLIHIAQKQTTFQPYLDKTHFTITFYFFTGKMILPMVLLIYWQLIYITRLPTLELAVQI